RTPPVPGRAGCVTILGSVPAAAAVAASAPSAAAAVAAATAPAASTPLLWPGPVDGQGWAVHPLAPEGGDGGPGRPATAYLDEAEPLGPAGVAVHDDLRGLDGAVGPEQLLQIAVGNAVGQVAHVQFPAHGGPPGKAAGGGTTNCWPA